MYTLKVKNDRGDMVTLSNNKNYTVTKITGLNPPKATVNRSVNATRDGSRTNSVKLESRNIVFYITIEGDIEANRLRLYNYFPIKKTVTIYFSHGSRNVYIEGEVESFECDQFTNKQMAQISVTCGSPYFKGMTQIISNFADITSLFRFPFAITESGTEFSVMTTNVRKSIINTGNVETGMVITLFATGTVVKPVIYDVLKKVQMALNITMQPSDTLVINTNTGEKAITLIRDGVSINAMGYMLPDSSWLILESGDNVFTYTCESGSANLQITFESNVLYSGV